MKLHNILKKFQRFFTPEDYVKSSRWENLVKDKIQELSENKLETILVGLAAGKAIKIPKEEYVYDPNRPLDILVTEKSTKKEVAIVEVQADYTRTYEQSWNFLVQAHKIEQAQRSPLPHYFVYILTKEPNGYYWLPREEIEREIATEIPTQLKGERVMQRQHQVPKGYWNKDLETLVKKLTEPKQKSLF